MHEIVQYWSFHREQVKEYVALDNYRLALDIRSIYLMRKPIIHLYHWNKTNGTFYTSPQRIVPHQVKYNTHFTVSTSRDWWKNFRPGPCCNEKQYPINLSAPRRVLGGELRKSHSNGRSPRARLYTWKIHPRNFNPPSPSIARSRARSPGPRRQNAPGINSECRPLSGLAKALDRGPRRRNRGARIQSGGGGAGLRDGNYSLFIDFAHKCARGAGALALGQRRGS